MPNPRASGVLLHPTSLPGPHGIGDLGPAAYQFVDFLAAARQQLWQVLPLAPTGYGDSPYAALSAFAGNPLLISLERLADEGLLSPADLRAAPSVPPGPVDYEAVRRLKLPLLRRAFARCGQAGAAWPAELAAFQEAQRAWLPDFALFMALREAHGRAAWLAWEPALAQRQAPQLAQARRDLAGEIAFHAFLQFVFFRQWQALRAYTQGREIRLVGDMPIFVAHDSADVWAQPDLFRLTPAGRPVAVAGVPPDYFSPTGQLWGNPIYNWPALAATGYAWWIERFRGTLALVDALRLDHFRGFRAYWEVPAGEETAIHGRWVAAPGDELFAALAAVFGRLPLVAEDLGVITPNVDALRERFGFPGMKVLQFAFDGGPINAYLPHNYADERCVVYTGTHDNDTTRHWFANLDEATRAFVCRYLASDGRDIAWDLIRLALSSVAQWAIVPLQDVLSLGGEARMNAPGSLGGNWRWRYAADQLPARLAERLAALTVLYRRDAAAGPAQRVVYGSTGGLDDAGAAATGG